MVLVPATSAQKLIEQQEQTVDSLKREIQRLQSEKDYNMELMQTFRPKAEFYLTMQRRAIADEKVRDALRDFLMTMRLVLPKDVRGFTKS